MQIQPENYLNVYAPWTKWSSEQTLHVAAAYVNPLRWETRRKLTHDFRHQMTHTPNVKLYLGELAYGDRPHEVTGFGDPNDLQLRTEAELFHKENILNRTIMTFSNDWKYGAIGDTDMLMSRQDWALETIHQLQHYDFVQCFSTYSDLTGSADRGQGQRPYRLMSSFAYCYHNRREEMIEQIKKHAKVAKPKKHHKEGCPCCCPEPPQYPYWKTWPGSPGATGGFWAFRRDAFEKIGGLPEYCILGSGDWMLAMGLAGIPNWAAELRHPATDKYAEYINHYQQNAYQQIYERGRGIGYIDNHMLHHFHGSKTLRNYGNRWEILRDNAFNPHTDLMKDHQGILKLAGNKPKFRDAIRTYFRQRNEDNPGLLPPERVLE